jgi:hypothetical protein
VLFVDQFPAYAERSRLAAKRFETERAIKLLRCCLGVRYSKLNLCEIRKRSGSLEKCAEQCASQTLPAVRRSDIHAPDMASMSPLETLVAIETGGSNQSPSDESTQHETVVTSRGKTRGDTLDRLRPMLLRRFPKCVWLTLERVQP